MQAVRFNRYKRTLAFRVTELDEERIQIILRKYKVPFGISRSSRMRALIRILAAEEKSNK